MPTVTIEESGCRDCSLCVEVCPTEVLVRDQARQTARVERMEDCIGCTSCVYICPSRCITVADFIRQRPFHRIEHDSNLVERLLQQQPLRTQLGPADYEQALADVRVRLRALGDAVLETMGRGQKAVGRAAGTVAASHLPEMYEQSGPREVLQAMRRRFGQGFDFEAVVAESGEITLTFSCCALRSVVAEAPGSAVLCVLFHEYWAGLVGAFTDQAYTAELAGTEPVCTIRLVPRS